jgi:hypothetical protein
VTQGLNRRQVLAGGLVAGAAWSAPAITQVSFATAAAQTETPFPDLCLVPEPDECSVNGVVPFGEISSALASVDGDSLTVAFEWEDEVVPAVSPTVICCGSHSPAELEPCVGDEVALSFEGCEISRQTILDQCGPDLPAHAIVRWYFSDAGAEATVGAAVVEAEVQAGGAAIEILSQRVRSDLVDVCVPVPAPEPGPAPLPSPTTSPTTVPRPRTIPAPTKVPKFSG